MLPSLYAGKILRIEIFPKPKIKIFPVKFAKLDYTYTQVPYNIIFEVEGYHSLAILKNKLQHILYLEDIRV